jgi:hypothetical protein
MWTQSKLKISMAAVFLTLISACNSDTAPVPQNQSNETPSINTAALQSRNKGESFKDVASRYMTGYKKRKPHNHRHPVSRSGAVEQDAGDSALTLARGLDQIDLNQVPAISDAQLASAFQLVRNTRYIQNPAQPDFPRRESWLYPDDGCFTRATLAAKRIEAQGITRPAKLFIFGDLETKTPNSPDGTVWWWYHVVAAYRLNGGAIDSLRIIDPSINPSAPMTMPEWAGAQIGDLNAVTFSACKSQTYEPGDSCTSPEPDDEASVLNDEYQFLDLEWERQIQLGRDPVSTLGDNPPW